MGTPLPWISPEQVDAMLYDDPDGSTLDFGFALMRPKAKTNRTADLARAKLHPREPADADWGSDGW